MAAAVKADHKYSAETVVLTYNQISTIAVTVAIPVRCTIHAAAEPVSRILQAVLRIKYGVVMFRDRWGAGHHRLTYLIAVFVEIRVIRENNA
ncbi:MAG: hypothetical protein CW742_07210 [Methanoregula sp.]|nr:MAG: hypothetical protein CW742_07210 [Methanoregula sp.]